MTVPTHPDTWAVLAGWRSTQISAGVSKNVVAQRTSHIKHLADYMRPRQLGPWSLTGADLDRYLSARSWTAQTRRNNAKSIRAFYRWAVANGHVDADPAESVRVNLDARTEAAINRHRVVFPETARTGPDPLSVPAAWSDLIDGWQTHAQAAGLSPRTLDVRVGHMRRVARDLHPLTPAEVAAGDLELWLANRTGISNEYRRALRSSIRALFSWAADTDRIADNPAHKLRVVKATTPLPRPASSHDYRTALAGADERQSVALMLAAEMGLRRAEVACIHARDVLHTDGGPVLVVHGKGDRPRLVPMTERMNRAVSALLAVSGGGYLFPGRDGGHLSARWLGKIVAAALPGNVTMHQLRHRFATVTYRATRDTLAVQQLLGHASAQTTQRYVAVDPDALRATVETAAGAYPRISEAPGTIPADHIAVR